MTRHRLCIPILALAAAAAMPATTTARGWSPTAVLASCAIPATHCGESAPRAAVNARGQIVVAWVAERFRVQVAAGGANGRFGRPITLGRGLRPSVAISAGGTQLVAWSDDRRLHFARRLPGRTFARTVRLAAPAGSSSDDSPKLAAQRDGSTLVLYENSYRDAARRFVTRLRSLVVSPRGRLGPIRDLGEGSIDRDGFRADAAGHAAVCCLNGPASGAPPALAYDLPRTHVARWIPGAGWSTVAPALAEYETIESVAPGGGSLALGTTDVRLGGEAASFGIPGLVRVTAGGAILPTRAAGVQVPRRAFGPVVALDGAGRDVIVYQEKDRPAAFSTTAPLYGATAARGRAFSARRTLDAGRAAQPAVRRYRDGAIVAWESPGRRWRVSIERGGRFEPAPAPDGLGPSHIGQDFHYNRDMVASGRWVVLAWTAIDGSIRASVGSF